MVKLFQKYLCYLLCGGEFVMLVNILWVTLTAIKRTTAVIISLALKTQFKKSALFSNISNANVSLFLS